MGKLGAYEQHGSSSGLMVKEAGFVQILDQLAEVPSGKAPNCKIAPQAHLLRAAHCSSAGG